MRSQPMLAERRFFAPEVVQISAMDCGPAALKCLLEGFGVSANYGRLREACQTGVDGSSIDAIEDMAVRLGLRAQQIMLPVDHLLQSSAQALPALVVTYLPNGFTHTMVVWRTHGRFVQVMDPAVGRRWLPKAAFLSMVYRHTLPIAAAAWRAYAGTPAFCLPLRQQLAQLGMQGEQRERLLQQACDDPEWRSLAALDAAVRLAAALVRGRALLRGREAADSAAHFFEQARGASATEEPPIPASFWSAQPSSEPSTLLVQGAVLVRVRGRRVASRGSRPTPLPAPPDEAPAPEALAAVDADAAADAILQPEPSPLGSELWRALRLDGLLTPCALIAALIVAAMGKAGEVLLLRGVMEVGHDAGLGPYRLALLAAFCVLAMILLLLELSIAATALRLGRRLEMRFRIAFLAKLPRLGDRYFHSRLISDMAERAHSLRQVRTVSTLGSQVAQVACQLLLSTAGVLWLAPDRAAPIAILATLWALLLALLIQPVTGVEDMRIRSHVGALSQFYLDALQGLLTLRAHSAERALRREHESVLAAWGRANAALSYKEAGIHALGALVGFGFAIWILIAYWSDDGDASWVLLLVYWTLNIPLLGQWLVSLAQQYAERHNTVRRIMEPLGAPDEEALGAPLSEASGAPLLGDASGVAIDMAQVAVRVSGRRVLSDVSLRIEAGEHVAIVGASGAGKSSLAGLLLGWRRPSSGDLLIDGRPLAGPRLEALRRVTAWVDPTVHIWNRSLLDNLQYGLAEPAVGPLPPLYEVVEQVELLGVIEHLDAGLQTPLGEGGGLLSGGEGQRVRLARALLRPGVRLAILDEPFRGLDSAQRRRLLDLARRHWRGATLLWIAHDVSDTQAFERVLVMEGGRIVEDANPQALAAQPASRYRALLDAEAAMRGALWEHPDWRRLYLDASGLRETPPDNRS